MIILVLNGSPRPKGSTAENFTVNVDEDSTWTLTEDTTVGTLNAAKGAKVVDQEGKTVSIVQDGKTVVEGDSDVTLTVSKYTTKVKTSDSNKVSTDTIDRTDFEQYYKTTTAYGNNSGSIGADLGSPMMGTTLAVLYLKKNSLWVCNIGDSRIFRLRDHLMEQVSVDHTDEKEMKAAGISGRKPVLTQYVGIDPEVYVLEPYISWKKIRKKDVYLICSDGVTDMVPESDIREILDSQMKPKSMVEKLIHSALDGGGRDNITATVLVFG